MPAQRTSRSFFAWAALSLTVVIACAGPSAVGSGAPATGMPTGSVPPDASTSPAESAGSNPASPSAIFDPPQPRDVTVVLDAENAVEALIPVEGGTISATGADGAVFTLEVPSDALLNETTMSLTPVSSITGMPFGGDQTSAVQLGPDGLFLQNFATLTITPATMIPVDQQIFFGYLADGKDVTFAPPIVGSSEVKINVMHFSGNGVTNGKQDSLAAVRETLGGDVARRLSSQMAEKLGRERALQLGFPEEGQESIDLGATFEEAWKQYEEQVVKPRLAAAGDSCDAGELALQTVLSLERDKALLGAGSEENVFTKYADLYNKVARTCVIEEFKACVEHHRIFLMLVVYHGLLQQNAIVPIYTAGTLNEARDLTVKCLTFRLELESVGRINYQGLASAESTVTMELMLRYNPDLGLISGLGEYINTDYEVQPPAKCSVKSTPGGGTFVAIGLLYEVESGAPDSDGNYPDAHVSAITLAYSPDNSSEKATLTCPDPPGAPSIIPFDVPTWSTAYFDAHLNELGAGGMTAVDWDVSGGELFAEKEWDLIGVADPLGSEEGSFKLYHVPGG